MGEETERGSRYAAAFSEGLEEKWSGEIEWNRLDLHRRAVSTGREDEEEERSSSELLRSGGVENADFVWIWGHRATAEILELLDVWEIPSALHARYAYDAYPRTVALEIRSAWKEAIERAIDACSGLSKKNSEGSPDTGRYIEMRGDLVVYPQRDG